MENVRLWASINLNRLRAMSSCCVLNGSGAVVGLGIIQLGKHLHAAYALLLGILFER